MADESKARSFLAAWHAGVSARDAAALEAMIHPDCLLRSPAFWTPKTGRALVVHILGGVIANVEGFVYRREWINETGDMIMLEFTGALGGKSLVGIDRIALGPDGRMIEIEVWARPLNALVALAEAMGEHLASFKEPA